jgi:hypothetical protein
MEAVRVNTALVNGELQLLQHVPENEDAWAVTGRGVMGLTEALKEHTTVLHRELRLLQHGRAQGAL